MRKLIPIIAVLLSIFSIDSSAFTRYVTTNLNLRYEPNAKSYRLTVIPKGTAVTIDEDCDCKWVPVEYNGQIGYISTKYLSSNKPIKSYTSYKRTTSNTRYSNTSHSTYSQGSIKYYTNVDGHRVQSPTYYNSKPAGATALCRDGTYSFSRNRRGTCSHHGGVARWL